MSSKRSRDSNGPDRQSSKIAKVHPFFSKSALDSSPLQWITAASSKTCVHGVHRTPQSRRKVAVFDLDGTIIKGRRDITWWSKGVPSKLKELHDADYSIVIVSNQFQSARTAIPMQEWKSLIARLAIGITDVPFRIFAATAKDEFRKPMPGIWYKLESIYEEDGISIDKDASFFVGDAAGRPYDHADTDRKWALNVDLPFFTPEEYFLKAASVPFVLKGFNVSSLPHLPPVTPTSTPLLPAPAALPEVVLFCGYPSLGKTSFFRQHFSGAGYTHINQDTLKRREKCVQAVQDALAAGVSCVVDNTNRDVHTRKFYIDVAKKFNALVRCFFFTGSFQLAWHNNLYRAFNLPVSVASSEPKRDLLPYYAFIQFRDHFEEPSLQEGFAEIRRVNFAFEGTAEARRRWKMWLQLDGDGY